MNKKVLFAVAAACFLFAALLLTVSHAGTPTWNIQTADTGRSSARSGQSESAVTNTMLGVLVDDIEGPDTPSPPKHYRTLDMLLAEAGLGEEVKGPPPVPVSGTRQLLVILAELSDATHNSSHSVAYFNGRFFNTTTPSVRDYFDEVSYGAFTYVPGGVRGWYPSTYTKAQYNSDPYDVFVEAIQDVDPFLNFASYDTNRDGVVENEELPIFLIVSGNSGGAAHGMDYPNVATSDGVSIEGEYSRTNEFNHMGNYCHELGHDLGLPDLYDVNGGSEGIGNYGLMGGGSWTFSHMTAWSKIQLGWITPTIVTENGYYDIDDAETNADAYILMDPDRTNEYFLIENRYPSNSYYETRPVGDPEAPNGPLPDKGIVIYHIDETKIQDWITSGTNNVNDDEAHKGVDVECADFPTSHVADADHLDRSVNRGDAFDLWDNTEYDFTDDSHPCSAIWYDGTNSGMAVRDLPPSAPTMRVFLFTAYATWIIETLDSAGNVGMYSSIAIGPIGNIEISYYDNTNDDLKHAFKQAGTWLTSTDDSIGDVGHYSSIAMDSNSYPHISYYDATNDALKHAWWNGSVWNRETVDSAGDVGRYSSIAIGPIGNIEISYYDATNWDLKHAVKSGSSWVTFTDDSVGDVGYCTSIAMDSNSYPHISYYDATNHALKHAWWNGSVWNRETVDSAGDVGMDSSIAIGPIGNIEISYYDWTNHDLKHAVKQAGTWLTSTDDSIGDVGRYSSIAMDSNSYPHISYYDWTNNALKHAWWNGSVWNRETVDSAGDVGRYSSIAIDAYDQPHISYYDMTNGNLKYAYCDMISPSESVPDDGVSGWSNDNTPTFTWAAAVDSGSGVAGYLWRVDGGNETWTTGTSVTVPAQFFGAHFFSVRAVDYAGNFGIARMHVFQIDTFWPGSPVPDDGVSGWSNDSTPAFSWSPVSDYGSGVAGYYWKVDSGGETWTTGTSVTVPAVADGRHTFYVRAKDNAGNYGSSGSHGFQVDTTPPAGTITINGGATYATSTPVTLSLTYSDATSGVSQVRYSNDGVWDTEPWEAPAATKAWTLTGGDGWKSVYYQVRDNAGNTATFSDTINLDTTAPTGSIVVNSGNPTFATSQSVTLFLAYDDGNGVENVRYSNDGFFDTEPWESPASSKAWTLTFGDGWKSIYYQVRDIPGNTAVFFDTIFLDTSVQRTVSGFAASPDPGVIGETVVVSAVLNPAPPSGHVYSGCYITVTIPDGNFFTYGPFNSSSSGAVSCSFVPDEIGYYSATFYGERETIDETAYSAFNVGGMLFYVAESSEKELTLESVTAWYWTSTTVVNSVAVGDVDGDGQKETVTGGTFNDGTRTVAQLVVWNSSSLVPERLTTWYWTGDTGINSVAIGDVDADGQVEIVTGGCYGDGTIEVAQLVVWSGSTLTVERLTSWYWTGDTEIKSVAIGDVDADGQVEIVTGGYYSDNTRIVAQLVVWKGSDLSVDRLTSWYWTDATDIFSVATGDVDADGQVEIVTGGYYFDGKRTVAQLVVWDGASLAVDRLTSWYWIDDTAIESLALGDVDADGQVEIVTGGYHYDGTRVVAQLAVWNGASLTAERITTWYWIGNTFICSVAVGDVDGDGNCEIVTGGFYNDGVRNVAQLIVWSGSSLAVETTRAWYWVGNTVIYSVCLSDLNGDFTAEIVTGGAYHDGSRWNAQLAVWGMTQTV